MSNRDKLHYFCTNYLVHFTKTKSKDVSLATIRNTIFGFCMHNVTSKHVQITVNLKRRQVSPGGAQGRLHWLLRSCHAAEPVTLRCPQQLCHTLLSSLTLLGQEHSENAQVLYQLLCLFLSHCTVQLLSLCHCDDVPSMEVPFSVLNSWHRTSTYQRLAPAWAKIWSWTMPSAVRVGRIKDLIIAAPRLLSSKAASSPYRDVISHVRFLFSSKERRPCTIWLRMVKQE